MTLDHLPVGTVAQITDADAWLTELGFCVGACVVKEFGGRRLAAYSVKGALVALRREDASRIIVRSLP